MPRLMNVCTCCKSEAWHPHTGDFLRHLMPLPACLPACRRFRDNVVVQGEPRIRFFVGAPLVASNGHRLGTLCYLGPQPRVTTAEEAMILANMAGTAHTIVCVLHVCVH
jgi:hypothetical protein